MGAFVVVASARSEVKLPSLLADHMVVQRELPVHIWGKASPGEPVTVDFHGASRSATADDNGLWSVYLPSVDAGGPFEITIRGSNTITLKDVLAGDVWIASGQSNMEFGLKNATDGESETAGANHPRMRLFHVNTKVASYPQDDAEVRPWAECTPATAANFSAVAYFFGRDLHEKLGVPVGLIESSWGGTPVVAWTSLRAISSDASLMPVFAEWARMTDEFAVTKIRRDRAQKEWRDGVERAKKEGTKPPGFPWEPNLEFSWMPAGLFNAMIAPLTPFPIRGVIWYQGESNASTERAPLYGRLFQAMIQDWRRAWAEPDFPFLFVQLANYKTGADSKWPALREAQRQTLALANTGMAVTIDIGNPDDIHPKNKQDVGLRLALAAHAVAYGEKIEYSGPLYRLAVPEVGAMRVWFTHNGAGLAARGGVLDGFEVAGADRKFGPGEARIDGATVLVSSTAITAPMFVRYAWADNPHGTLYNVEGLPASPFNSGE